MEQLQFSQLMTRLADLVKASGSGKSTGHNGHDSIMAEAQALGYTFQVIATGASTRLLPVNLKRTFLYILNNDALGYARVAFGSAATLSSGIILQANGGGILLDVNVPKAQLYIIGSIANNPNITLIEA